MSEPTIAELLAENQRLNKLITVLLEQNDQLKAALSLSLAGNGKTEAGSSNSLSITGNTDTLSSYRTPFSGKTDAQSSYSSPNNGNKLSLPSLPAQIPSDEKTVTQLLEMFEGTSQNLGPLSGRKNIIRLLIHIYNGGSGAHTTLQGVMRTTASGTAKALTSLKKKGWIQRVGWQRFALTEMAKERLARELASQ